MFRKPWTFALIVVAMIILLSGVMVTASPVVPGGEKNTPLVGSDTGLDGVEPNNFATVITVDSGLDLDTSGTGIRDDEPITLRRAINAARGATKPVLIEFDIPTTCPSYNSDLDLWKIELLGVQTGAPANTTFRQLNGNITIDGTTQNGRSDGPTIILYGEGATGARNCMVLGESALQGGNVIRGLGFQNFRDSITVSSVNNTIEDCWFGLNDAGTAPELRGNNPASGSGDTGIVLANLNNDGSNIVIQNNKFLGLNGTAATIRGRDNIFRDNWIGMAADGTVINPGCTPDNWLGGGGIVVQNRRHLIEGNRFAGLRFEQFDLSQPPDAIRTTVDDVAGAGHTIRDNIIGLDINGVAVGTCGRGITANNHMRGTLIENNTIVNTSQGGIFLNGGVYNQCELRGNILIGTTIEYGEGLPDAFAEYLPAKVTSIDGTSVSGTSGDGSPGPNNIIELFLDYTDSPVEARESLAIATADADGNWQATLSDPLPDGAGIRTTSTSTQFGGIPGRLAGTTTGLSELYIAKQPAWQEITTLPARALTSGNGLVSASFDGFGIWLNDGAWNKLADATALALATDGNILAVSVEGFGIWVYDGSWSQLISETADLLAADNGMIVASFANHGIWLYDGNTWTNLTPVPARALDFDSGRIVASVDGFGTWRYDGISWQQLTSETAQIVALSGNSIVASFAGFGIWSSADGHTWNNLVPVPARALALDNGMLAVSIDGSGTWLNDGDWNNILQVAANLLAIDSGKVVASFEELGLWLYE